MVIMRNTNTENILLKAGDFDRIIIPVYAKVKIKTGTVGLPESQISLINEIIKLNKETIVISFGNPYIIQGFPGINTYICAYGDCESSIYAVIRGISGEIKFRGKLPVTISDEFIYGTGIKN